MALDLNKGFKVGRWHVEPLRGAIRSLAESRHLEPKVMDVLVRLAEEAGDLVSRAELLRAVWGERAVSDEPLTRAIGELRRALGDSREAPQYVETVPKRGYRLLVPVVPMATAEQGISPNSIADVSEVSDRRLKRHHWAGFAAAAAVVAGLWWTTVDEETVTPSADVRVAVDRSSRPTVAVLPFCELGGENQAYFGQGLAEDLTTLLARSPELFVISNTSASQFACQPRDLPEVGKALGVRYLVTGSNRVAAGRDIRVTARLVDTASDRVVWSQSYQRELSPAASLAIQSEIAAHIARALEVTVMNLQGSALTQDPTAWELYARGRFLLRNPANPGNGRDLLEQAIALDPEFAEAHAYLGMSYTARGLVTWDPELRRQLFDQAEQHIEASLSLDPDNHVGQTQLGYIYHMRGRTELAMASLDRAIEAVPSYDTAWHIKGQNYMLLGDADAAQRAFDRAFRLNPLPPRGTRAIAGTVSYVQGQVSKAVELWEQTRRENPGLGQGAILLAYHYQSTGRHDEARAIVAEILELNPDAKASWGLAYLQIRLAPEWIPEDLVENLRAAGLP